MINTPIIISNRIGNETEFNQSSSIDFWGSGFITDSSGNIVKKCQSIRASLIIKSLKMTKLHPRKCGILLNKQ